jgi:hypothetical protein
MMQAMLLLVRAALLSGASAGPSDSALTAVPCLGAHVGCNATFGTNSSGCCALADPQAVCCQTVLVGPSGPIVPGNEGLKRSYCCPSGSQCTERGCTRPIPAPRLCGPTQGDNCNVSYLCTSGPADWTRTAGPEAAGRPAVLVIGDSVSNGWTPVLSKLLAATHTVVHSPGRMTDGGARSTSNLVNCADYLLSTDLLEVRRSPALHSATVRRHISLRSSEGRCLCLRVCIRLTHRCTRSCSRCR